jgi:hypothetical protein
MLVENITLYSLVSTIYTIIGRAHVAFQTGGLLDFQKMNRIEYYSKDLKYKND